ncbi:hypothetical protein PNOK_0210500 [Pyrrhoderma noxium]|uniref:Mid2 domain-containing protein n=1 Tax=Pyrrhoderma noxium TaxID=2282107 RepID=A0A286URC4_9AGAM|nr:hypothetical protein PNOK_0210500 [Pyrrhoderma noxium]
MAGELSWLDNVVRERERGENWRVASIKRVFGKVLTRLRSVDKLQHLSFPFALTMLANNRHSFILSLLLALTLVITLANAAIDVNTAHRRQATRMIKKRQGGVAGLLGVGSDPATVTSADTVAQSSTTESSATKETSTSSGTTTTANLISTILSDITRTGGTSTSTSSTSTATSSSTSTSSTSSTTSTLATTSSTVTSTSSTSSSTTTTSSSSTSEATLQFTQAPDEDTSSSTQQLSTSVLTATVTGTSDASEASATETANATSAASKGISKTTITILIVIAATVGGSIILWTIIRKWKFSPSSEFEDRMQPIDWSPAPDHRSNDLHRTASNASHGSFHSGSEHGSARTYGTYGNNNSNNNNNSNLVSDIPNHDFTAGPANMGAGYADLTRGASPAPQMSQAGASVNYGYGYGR